MPLRIAACAPAMHASVHDMQRHAAACVMASLQTATESSGTLSVSARMAQYSHCSESGAPAGPWVQPARTCTMTLASLMSRPHRQSSCASRQAAPSLCCPVPARRWIALMRRALQQLEGSMHACMQVVAFLNDNGYCAADTPLVLGGDFNSLWRKHRSDPFDQARSAFNSQDRALEIFHHSWISKVAATAGAAWAAADQRSV